MERKLVKQGRNALTVTLPAGWLRQRRLKAGESVYVVEHNQELAISARMQAEHRSVTLDLRKAERPAIWHIVGGRYIEGFDEIIILHDKPRVLQIMGQQLIGMIVESHSAEKTVLKSIISVPEKNFDAVLRRAAHILVELARMLEEVAGKKATYEELKETEYLLNSNILYCLRYMTKYATSERAYKQFLLCTTIEDAGDIITAIAKHIANDVALAKKIKRVIDAYAELLFKKDFKSMYGVLRDFRDSIAKKRFVDGLTYQLAETLYNNIGYLVKDK